jgi:hypothetical protein
LIVFFAGLGEMLGDAMAVFYDSDGGGSSAGRGGGGDGGSAGGGGSNADGDGTAGGAEVRAGYLTRIEACDSLAELKAVGIRISADGKAGVLDEPVLEELRSAYRARGVAIHEASVQAEAASSTLDGEEAPGNGHGDDDGAQAEETIIAPWYQVMSDAPTSPHPTPPTHPPSSSSSSG